VPAALRNAAADVAGHPPPRPHPGHPAAAARRPTEARPARYFSTEIFLRSISAKSIS
jgi:hypothetical protein